MATEAPSVEHQELASRVTTLTKSLRRTRLALLAVASFGVVGFLALWARSAPSDSVTAKNFLLVDREGRLSGEWLVRNGVPQFQLLHRGKPGVDLRAGEEPSLTLRDGDQIDRIALEVRTIEGQKEPGLTMFGATETPMLRIRVQREDAPSIDLYDGFGKHRLTAQVAASAEPRLALFDGSGKGGIGMLAGPQERALLYLQNSEQTPQLSFSLIEKEAALTVQDANGSAVPVNASQR